MCIASSFTNIGSILASKIPHSEKHFTTYIEKSNIILENDDLTTNEFETAFNSIKINKASGFDDITSNVVKLSYNELVAPLFHICKTSLKMWNFPR